MKEREEDNSIAMVRVSPADMEAGFYRILLKHGFSEKKARTCAQVFTENSVDGIYTHGVNRFPRFVEYIKSQYVLVDKEPVMVSSFGAMEQWNGSLGPGPLNAIFATERAMEIARKNGMGCVALANTNHWMRGGFYGWKAAKAGFVFIGWTNAVSSMPAWNAADSRLGNNPLVIAMPYGQEAIVLDMAMSQYSFGGIELNALKQKQLDVPGGYDLEGNLTKDPAAIMKSKKGLPIGYWKGSGMALLLDILAAVLSGGIATNTIDRQEAEYGVSQVFMAIDISKLRNYASIAAAVESIIQDYHGSVPVEGAGKIIYPGERVLMTRKENLEKGIPVMNTIWNEIKNL